MKRDAKAENRVRVFRGIGVEPVVFVLLIVWGLLAFAHDRFLTPVNLTNLLLQTVAVGTISLGVVLVLLLGEIDLSVGAVSGLAGGVLASLSVKWGWPAPAAIGGALAVGATIGLFQGVIATRLGIPSFVVTLAGLLAWQGMLLLVLGNTGTINVTASGITDLAGSFLGPALGWAIAAGAIVALVFSAVHGRVKRRRAGLSPPPVSPVLARTVPVCAAIVGFVALANSDRGVPVAALIFVALALVLWTVCTRTAFGRHIYAIGGNAEAARRAGIAVLRTRTIVFVLASTLAAAGGVLAAARLLAATQSSGSGNLLLFAIAGPVIAGVSLFGGRGRIWAAALGVLVVGSIANGLDLLAWESSLKFILTGAVLLLAVSLDAVARRRATV